MHRWCEPWRCTFQSLSFLPRRRAISRRSSSAVNPPELCHPRGVRTNSSITMAYRTSKGINLITSRTSRPDTLSLLLSCFTSSPVEDPLRDVLGTPLLVAVLAEEPPESLGSDLGVPEVLDGRGTLRFCATT